MFTPLMFADDNHTILHSIASYRVYISPEQINETLLLCIEHTLDGIGHWSWN